MMASSWKTLRALAGGRSALFITHSLAGIEDADPVLVLSAGTIVERGRHEDLVAQGGLYHRMWFSAKSSLAD
jgi:ATP-binding cassette subfamily B tetracycline resistance protein